MNIQRKALLVLIGGLLVQPAFPARAQSSEGAGVTSTSAADGTRGPNNGSPALTGARHPLYRLRKSGIVGIKFTFSPEFDQTVTVQPDGFVALKAIGDVFAEGSTISELRDSVRSAYAATLHDPEVSVILNDFERPFFLAGGQVGHPGKYELRSPTSVAEAIAIAGGFTDQSKHSCSQAMFRRMWKQWKMLALPSNMEMFTTCSECWHCCYRIRWPAKM